jgi:energy-coupling factor transporter ATP-binding protein EcfA2/ABC-type antimicrobial peptide transport system permease subunit
MIGIQDPKIIEDRVHYILRAVNMYPYRKKRALQLSGGQQQRVAIARALVKNPRIIIADEPTGNLDSKNTLEVMNIIKQISMEKLVVLVTHEKDIANFYGDRIIELKDGEIISDSNNEVNHEHTFSNDDVIYLKDLNQLVSDDNEALKVALYQDHSEHEEPISVRLIVKNKTLYLDVSSPYQKLKLIDKNSGVTIKDEHYVKKTREELIETTFDLSVLDNKDVKRQPKLLVSLKQIIWMALIKVSKTSRKGKIMLFSFLVAGMVIAFTLSFLASVVVLEPERYIVLGKDYVSVSDSRSNKNSYEDILEMGEGDNQFLINTFDRQIDLRFYLKNSTISAGHYARIDYSSNITKSRLVRGDVPESPYEVLVSKALADTIVKSYSGQNMGIWSYTHLLQEQLEFNDMIVDIVGIVDAEQELIYMHPFMASYVYDTQFGMPQILGYELFEDELIILGGTIPEDGQVMISKTLSDFLSPGNNQPFPRFINGISYPISGIYQTNSERYPNILATNKMIDELRFDEAYTYYVRTSDKKALIAELDDPGIEVTDLYKSALDSAKAQRDIVLYSSLGTAGFIIGFAMLGFYFIIRSSLISRIYEISVYRALGVKKSEIFRSFMMEIVVLTTLSTLIGYILASTAIGQLQKGLLGDLNLFKITPITFLVGLVLIYLINILAGLFPVYLLLRKTPAQILSQYDI